MTDLDLDPKENLLYFTQLEKAIETVPLAQKSATEAHCILTDSRLKVCGKISAIPMPPAERGCFDMRLAEIRDVVAGSVDDQGTAKPGVTVRGQELDTVSHSFTLVPLSGTETSAEELAAQIERARSV